MKKNQMAKLGFTLFSAGLISANVMADDANLKATLEKMGATNVRISNSAIPNFKTASSNEGVVYISNDGHYVLNGQIQVLELKNGKVTDITHQSKMTELNALQNEMITYPAKNEKYVVNIFMDITCHYCHLVHQRIKEYNDEGITLRFLAFPRGGMNTQTARQMEAIWTATDKVKALNDAENGELPKTLKAPNIVKKHYDLGIQFGVTGTPYMVTETGSVIGGYVEPKQLAKMLAEEK
ncbi:bifunctional protein-disulfide isomerase/oxidoreductase DsbC [Haemophilus parahaemolyticus]